jgi:gamma-glutamyltranspeptidase/glutathione hydrolase
MYSGPIAEAIVAKIGITTGADGSVISSGKTTLADLAAYQPKKRAPVCIACLAYRGCGTGPPSSGGLAVTQALGVVENFSLVPYAPTMLDPEGGKPTVTGVHLVSEAERLAYADHGKYVADADFVPLPGMGVCTMFDKNYLRQRASMASSVRSMGVTQPGDLGPVSLGSDTGPLENGTTKGTVMDKQRNVVTMTTTVASSMGSYHMASGFILNNQLTDFSSLPADAGGGTIIQYVIKALVGVLDWKLDAQQATSMADFGAANSATTNVGAEHPDIDASNGGANNPLVTCACWVTRCR